MDLNADNGIPAGVRAAVAGGRISLVRPRAGEEGSRGYDMVTTTDTRITSSQDSQNDSAED